jgi:hypothetical protein
MKRITTYAFLLLMLAGATSCKKWLSLKPQNGLVREDYWKTKEQVDAAVTGIYASMLGSNGSDLSLAEYFFMWGETRTDMVSPGVYANSDEYDIVNLNILSTNRYAKWSSVYQTINYCNTVIELAPGVLENDNTFTQDHLNRALGEAHAIRALMYFYLTRVFRDVPLKLKATISDEDITPLPKTSADSVLLQIVADLKEAETELPTTYGDKNTDKGRATRYTVNAILADVYLWMEKYADCVAECNKVINSGKFGLIGGDYDMFNELYYKGNSNESIFELQFDAQKLNPFYSMHLAATRRWGAASNLMEDVFGVDHVNAIPLVDARGEGNSLRASDLTIWKYIGANSTGSSLRSADQSYAHWIFYRYADILLMKAEAVNQQNDPQQAAQLVTLIRTRAHAFDFANSMDPNSQSAMEEYILQERQREFAFEGKRWFDVLRNAKRNNYQNIRYLMDMAAISVPQDRQQVAFNKLKDPNSHYLPISLSELQTNKLLVQNPFYK